jgi:hypothetical protein
MLMVLAVTKLIFKTRTDTMDYALRSIEEVLGVAVAF